MTVTAEPAASLTEAVRAVSEEVARQYADEVDRDARFPSETLAALRRERALAALVPAELGGVGATLEAVAQCCRDLARGCSASAMVFAMHQIQVATIIRHMGHGSWFQIYLERLATEQRLIASVTSEVGTDGDVSRSVAAVRRAGQGAYRFEKRATTVSYGSFADDLLTTLRRHPDAEPGDQVAVLTVGDQHSLQQTGTWDVLGMRGTCSPAFIISGGFTEEQILPDAFAQVAAESMVPISHVLWSHVWLGIAEEAAERARAFARAAVRGTSGHSMPSSQRVARLMGELAMLRSEVASALADFTAVADETGRPYLSTLAAALRFNNLKISASEHAADVCRQALDVCGIAGFRNDSAFSIGRQLRDAMSGPLMIANDRIRETNAGLLLIAKGA